MLSCFVGRALAWCLVVGCSSGAPLRGASSKGKIMGELLASWQEAQVMAQLAVRPMALVHRLLSIPPSLPHSKIHIISNIK